MCVYLCGNNRGHSFLREEGLAKSVLTNLLSSKDKLIRSQCVEFISSLVKSDPFLLAPSNKKDSFIPPLIQSLFLSTSKEIFLTFLHILSNLKLTKSELPPSTWVLSWINQICSICKTVVNSTSQESEVKIFHFSLLV